MSRYPKSAAQVRHMEHDSDAPETKKVSMYGYDSDALSKVRITASADGYLRIVLMAEDVDNPGTYQEVQGQFNADGNFELLTAGSGGTSTPATSRIMLEDGSSDILLESGDGLALEA